MKNDKKQFAFFYCVQQTDRVTQLVQSLEGSGNVEIRKISLPCSGKLEVFYLTKALETGADGVVLFGCLEEQCQYLIGSKRAMGRIRYAQNILKQIGLEGDRIHRLVFENHSPLENLKVLSDWIEKIKSMGSLHPGPIEEGTMVNA